MPYADALQYAVLLQSQSNQSLVGCRMGLVKINPEHPSHALTGPCKGCAGPACRAAVTRPRTGPQHLPKFHSPVQLVATGEQRFPSAIHVGVAHGMSFLAVAL